LRDVGQITNEISSVLLSFGIEGDDKRELRADFMRRRRWRKSVQQAQGYTVRATVTAMIGGELGALWLGVRAAIGK